ncbi:sulfite exporter TauE/SafE family protein [soil metagenome]
MAALLRGFTGFGFSLAAVPLLGMFMPPAQAVPVAIGLQLLGSLMDFRGAAKVCHWPSLRWLMAGAAIGWPLGTLVLSHISAPVARLAISSITLLAVLVLGKGFALKDLPGRAVTATAGFCAGVFNGLAAMPGPPAVAYYMSVPLSRVTTRASLLVFFLMTSITAMAAAASLGLITSQSIGLSLLGLPVMWLGTRLGHIAFTRGSDLTHRRVSIASLGVIALTSAIKGLGELA